MTCGVRWFKVAFPGENGEDAPGGDAVGASSADVMEVSSTLTNIPQIASDQHPADLSDQPSTVRFTDTLPTLDTDQFAEHLGALHEGARGGVCLAWISAGGIGSWKHAWANDNRDVRGQLLNDAEHWRPWLTHGEKRWQLYTGVGSFHYDDDTGYHRTNGALFELPGMWADIDVGAGLDNHFQSRAELDEYIALLPPPSLLVNTGSGGCHLYWLFNRRIQHIRGTSYVEDLRKGWHAYLQNIAGSTLIDDVHDAARVLRVAGSVRWSERSEMARGMPPFTRVTLAHVSDIRYDAAELMKLVAPAYAEVKQRKARRRAHYVKSRALSLDSFALRGVTPITQRYLEKLFNDTEDWGVLLGRAGWGLVADLRGQSGRSACRYWNRPGHPNARRGSASTDYRDSTLITFFSSEIARVDELIHPEIPPPKTGYGCTTKYRFALIALFDGDEAALLRSIATGRGRLT